MSVDLAEVLALPVSEKVQIVEAIWDSIAASPESLPLTEEQRVIVEERVVAYQADGNPGSPWAEARERILGKK